MNVTSQQSHSEICPTCGRQYAPQTGFCPDDGASLVTQMNDPLLGTRLPRNYLITERLGRGAMSMVYQGLYEPLNQPVAIKLLKSHLVSDLQTFKRFQQESKTAGALDHPNIVSIFDFGVTDQGVPYLIMELVRGESLLMLLRKHGWLPTHSALRIFLQTADALEYTHQRGVIHRDIKPSNLLVTRGEDGSEQVKIVDFGIAKMQDYQGNPSLNLTQTGEVFGTPLYISPEQAMGRTLDHRADIYSLGCVIYEAITGRPPFNAPTAMDVLRMQCTELQQAMSRYRPENELPPHLVSAVDRCLVKDPRHRYQTMELLAIDLQRAEIEDKVARESVQDRQSATQSKVTPIEGLKPLRRTPPQAAPALQSPVNLSDADGPPSAQSLPGIAPGAIPQAHRAPGLALAAATAAGCLVGACILIFNHPGSSGTVAGQTHANAAAIESEQVGPQASATVLDGQIAEIRDHALSLYDNGQFAVADTEINRALSLARDKKDTLAAGILQADLCMVDLSLRKFPDAVEAGNSAVKILDGNRQVADKDLAFALRGLGTAEFYHGDLDSAEKLLTRSTQLDKRVYGDRDERYAIGIARLAKVLEDEKKLDQAEDDYREALLVSQSCHQPGDQHLVMRLRTLASFLRRRHHNAEAQALEHQARALLQSEPQSDSR